MLRKMISFCIVVFAVFFAVNISADEAVKATAPVDGVVVAEVAPESPCGCVDSRLIFGKRLLSPRKTLRFFEPAPCVLQTETVVVEETVVPRDLVRIPAFKKLQHGFAKTHVWVEKQCGCQEQCECVKPTNCGCPKTCPVQWVPFPAYKKGFFSLRNVEAWKPVPVCHTGG
ncbi:MAG: hypothetical protein LBE12_12070 [Planctomycetaceae bacterium]|jgi:hypothetical protein|nr:hypothetical protein [Planctomycetaceae bacterium]